MIKSGASDQDMFEELPAVAFKFQRGIEKARYVAAPKRDPNVAPELEIYWGDSGTGKTRKAVMENPGAYILSKSRDGKGVWWQNYKGEKTVIIDEFYGWIPYDQLLRIIDRYPYEVEYKGGSTQLAATKIIITSNKKWTEWYSEELKAKTENFAALERRIKEFGKVTHFAKYPGFQIQVEQAGNDLGFA